MDPALLVSNAQTSPAHESSLLILSSSDTKVTGHSKGRPAPTWRKPWESMLSMIIEPAASNPQGLLSVCPPVWLFTHNTHNMHDHIENRWTYFLRKSRGNTNFHVFSLFLALNFRRIYAWKLQKRIFMKRIRNFTWEQMPPTWNCVKNLFFA